MTRSQLAQMPEYFDRYINECDNVSIEEALSTAITEIQTAPFDLWKTLGNQVYAQGKWTVKEILQHLVDTNRIFTFRALTYARREKQQVFSYDEDAYAAASDANRREISELVEELATSYQSASQLFRSFTPEMLNQMIPGFKGLYPVASVGFVLPGHQRWHLRVLKERYYPLLDKPL